jgi:putative Mn2+ efflux pump MntP
VALIEGRGGLEACKRSFELVRSDWLRTAIMMIVFGILSAVAHWTANVFVPRSSFFLSNFLGDLLLLVIMPVPMIASFLLYLDLRRKVDGLDDDRIAAELDKLRPVA